MLKTILFEGGESLDQKAMKKYDKIHNKCLLQIIRRFFIHSKYSIK